MRYQISYRRTDTEGVTVPGSVTYRAPHVGQAIDWTRAELAADDDTASFIITDAREISA